MRLELVTDKDRIHKVLKDPEVWDRIAEDHIDKDSYIAPDAIYLMDTKDRALMIYHYQSSVCLECHVQVLKEHRDIAYEFGQAALRWAFNNTDAVIVAQIPAIFPDVLKFALKNGFKIEGVNHNSYFKRGEICSQTYLGVSKWDLLERQPA